MFGKYNIKEDLGIMVGCDEEGARVTLASQDGVYHPMARRLEDAVAAKDRVWFKPW